jgi:hypothetical protein
LLPLKLDLPSYQLTHSKYPPLFSFAFLVLAGINFGFLAGLEQSNANGSKKGIVFFNPILHTGSGIWIAMHIAA